MNTYEAAKQIFVAVTAQNDAEPARQEARLEEINSNSPDFNEDNGPSPAYDDDYDQVCHEKGGSGTSASVTEDGRVDIRINQLNRRLSQMFTSTLHKQTRTAQDTQLPPVLDTLSNLGSGRGSKPAALNIVIQVVGSRGDV
ncbi:hypothetical protein NW762_012436 [Fusarium torreyae]|uniref:Uncharacterized protein n=1 Tax=Fusarium torreyae TaxID=1237075 RepID=A0A9W8RR70_9HYPO|nr:hypothetical protein NW762_012436 [Fusarium torreyae]